MPFENASHFQISGSSFTDVRGDHHAHYAASTNERLKLLKESSSVSASHDSQERFPPPRCLEGTRKCELKAIREWAEGAGSSILWLSGGVGAGKSAIAQTFAEWCADNKRLAASFFFCRGDEKRASTRCICATLALQLATSLPATRMHIEQVLDVDPLILDKDFRTQFRELVKKPFEAVVTDGTSVPSVVVVDALDECDDPGAVKEFLLVLLDNNVSPCSKRTPFRYFITSRPEYGIQSFFRSAMSHQSMILDESGDTNDDIRFFLKTRFSEIRENNKDVVPVGMSWPPNKSIDRIVRKSSGHFIYASTVLGFVDDDDAYPPDQLDIVLDAMSPLAATSQSPFEALDELYREILERASKRNPSVLKDIIGALVVTRFQATVVDLATSLCRREVDITVALRSLQSLIRKNNDLRGIVQFLHASFPDFLLDSTRSRRFAVDCMEYHEMLALRYLKLSHETRNKPDTFFFWLRNTSYYLTRCVSPLSQDTYDAFRILVLSKLDHFPERISQHSPEKIGSDILQLLLTSTFAKIYPQRRSNTQSPWPSSDDLDFLVEKFCLIPSDQLFAVLVVLNFINRRNPLRRLDRLLQVLRRKHTFWRLDTLHEWVFQIVCDSDHRAHICLCILAMIDATQQSGITLTNEVIESVLRIPHYDLLDATHDLRPLIDFHSAGDDLVFKAGGGFITSCLQHDWSRGYKIGKRDEWYVDLTLNCIEKRNHWQAEGNNLWINLLIDCPPSTKLLAALQNIDRRACGITRNMANKVIEWLRMASNQCPTLIQQWEEYRDQTHAHHVAAPIPEVEACRLLNSDIIIAVTGATGVGKSSFIKRATGRDGRNWSSNTGRLQITSCHHPKSGCRVVFLETPGFDDDMTDAETLIALANWLTDIFAEGIYLASLLFLHRISNPFVGTWLRNIHMFGALWGMLPNVMIVTTMWDDIDKKIGTQREEELLTICQERITAGLQICRFGDNYEFAWELMDRVVFDMGCALQLQFEMLCEKKRLRNTVAGSMLSSWLEDLISQFQKGIREFEVELRRLPKDQPMIANGLLHEMSATQHKLDQATNQLDLLNSHDPVPRYRPCRGRYI